MINDASPRRDGSTLSHVMAFDLEQQLDLDHTWLRVQWTSGDDWTTQ